VLSSKDKKDSEMQRNACLWQWTR